MTASIEKMVRAVRKLSDLWHERRTACQARNLNAIVRAEHRVMARIMRREAAYMQLIAELEVERDLYMNCCRRAFQKWRETHPHLGYEKDGADQIVDLLKAAERLEKGGLP